MNTREQLRQLILGKQGITSGEAAQYLGLAQSSISYHCEKLGADGLLFTAWDRGKLRLFVRTYFDAEGE